MSRILWTLAVLLVLGALGAVAWVSLNDNVGSISHIVDGKPQPRLPTTTMKVNGQTFTVELARSAEEQRQGLSFRLPLASDEGMLFIYDVVQPQQFWMFGMKFPLDIIFIREGTVVYVAENVPAPTGVSPPVIVTSPTDADMVLELVAGTAERAGMMEGTRISFE